MSQSSAVRAAGRPARRPVGRPAPAPPRLRVVAAPARPRSRAGLMVGCLVLLATGLVGLLLLNVNLEHGAYVLERLQTRQQQLQEQQQALQEQLNSLQAPGNLAARAAKLGMVPDPGVAFVRAGSGKVLGVPSPVVASPSPTVSKASPAGGTSASGAPSRGTGRAAARSPSTGAATSAPTPTP